jgi:hypothetical protein
MIAIMSVTSSSWQAADFTTSQNNGYETEFKAFTLIVIPCSS